MTQAPVIRLSVPSIEEDDLAAVRAVLATGFLVQGPHVAQFEEAICNITGSRFAVAMTNCTAALQLALLAMDVRPGDLVLVTAYSWISTANVIELCGATPVFVDIDPKTFNMCPDDLVRRLDHLKATGAAWRRVRAILPVHTFGQMADMSRLLEIAAAHGLPVIEDAACALGATFSDGRASAMGKMGCLSFHPRKAVTTGEGGAVTTDDPALAKTLRALRNHGLDPDAGSPDFIAPGFNVRMTEFQAALGVTQLQKLKRVVEARRRIATCYDTLLQGTPIASPYVPAGSVPTYQSYVTLLPAAWAPKRARLISELKLRGIETNIGTWHMPMTRYFRSRYGFNEGDFPVADDVFARAFTLPLYEGLSESDAARVVETVVNVGDNLS